MVLLIMGLMTATPTAQYSPSAGQEPIETVRPRRRRRGNLKAAQVKTYREPSDMLFLAQLLASHGPDSREARCMAEFMYGNSYNTFQRF
jgi:hypothetical protein